MLTRTLVVAGASLALASAIVSHTTTDALAGEPTRPNIVVFITDDQAEGTLDAMPVVRSQIKAQGGTLNGVIPTSLCCPSRSALLSGQYAHTTDVYNNAGAHGGWPTFYRNGTEDHTVAVALHDAGYHTGLFGKYLNGYGGLAPADYVPPGWDDFRAIFKAGRNPVLAASAYYNYYLHGTGEDVWYGSGRRDYSTDVITRKSVKFIEDAPADQPLMLYFATSGPHAPFTPAPRHIGTWHREELSPAAYQLTKNRPRWRPDETLDPIEIQTKQQLAHEALMSVDEGIGAVIEALGDRADNTLFVFFSDNGLQFGEHGLKGKNEPYSGSTDVPMLLRWDGVIPAGSVSQSPVTNADLTATIAEAAGVDLVRPDGVSWFAPDRPTGVTLESVESANHPAYCGYRTSRYLYVEYNRGREFFDYRKDPNELVNKVGRPRYQNRVADLRAKAQAGCTPTPPGFSW